MRRFRGHERGLAEIVGTLMLVLIVVVAVTAFAAFVASYQAQLQKEQAAAHQRSLEDIRILSVSTVAADGSYSSLSFVAGSLDINTMEVNELLVNGQFVNYYTVTPLGSAATLDVCVLCNVAQYPSTVEEFNLTSLEQVTVSVNLSLQSASNPTGGFLNPYTLATSGPTNYVSISLYTVLGNDFVRTFSAPTAVAVTEQSETYSPSGYTPAIMFDGSGSIVPMNDSIVSWSWSIVYGDATCFELSGEKALLPQSTIPFGSYLVMLTISDSNGLVSSATIPLTSPVTTPAIMACSTQGPVGGETTLVGTGFTGGTTVSATFAGTVLTFTSCSSGTLTPPGTITPSGGGFSCSFDIPASSVGAQTIQATYAGTTATPTTTFFVTTPTITLAPAQGPSGTTVTVLGDGFTPQVTITFAISGVGILGAVSPCTSGPTGAFAGCSFTVSGAADPYTITATGSDATLDAASAPFTVT